MTELLYSDDARNKMLKGVEKVADAVRVTLGASGRNVIIGTDPNKLPHITKDGVTVANNINNLEDPYESMGAKLIKEAARKTMSVVGDGTTTATVLTHAIIKEGLRLVSEGANPMELSKDIVRATDVAVEHLNSQARRIKNTAAQTKAVALVSANGDKDIAAIISEAMEKVGNDGQLFIGESGTHETLVTISEGLQIDRGYISDSFMIGEQGSYCTLINPIVVLYDKEITLRPDIEPIMAHAYNAKRSLLIIAPDVRGEALHMLTTNKIHDKLQSCAIKTPPAGAYTREMMEDIATIVGGTVISEEKGMKLSTASFNKFGSADQVNISKFSTTILKGGGKKKEVEQRITHAHAQLAECTNDFDKQVLERRIAILVGGVGVIAVGGRTEVEVKERKDRMDDALKAVKAAISEGVVPGGGAAYVRTIKHLEKLDKYPGLQVIIEALKSPANQIFINAGQGDHTGYQAQSLYDDQWLNAHTMEYENFFETGIVDPVKVTRVALENAASIARLFLTTECAIIEK